MNIDNEFEGMGDLAEESVNAANARLSEEEAALLRKTTVNLERYRPQIKDAESFNKLIAAVQTSTKNNESVAEFKNRISALGSGVMSVAGKVAKLAFGNIL